VSKYDGKMSISVISNGDHSHLSAGTSTLKPVVCSTLKISATQQNYYKGGNKKAVLEEKQPAREQMGFDGREDQLILFIVCNVVIAIG
jgi:hypothetical protein